MTNIPNIHPTAFVEEGAIIGERTTIGPFCLIRKGAVIGKNCQIGAYCEIREYAYIGDDTSLGSRCTISARGYIGNNVTIKYGFVLTDTPDLENPNLKDAGVVRDGVLIGANVTLMPGFIIGYNSVIGACSQVRSDIPEDQVWFGNPAKLYALTHYLRRKKSR